jgi:hypothetical protein
MLGMSLVIITFIFWKLDQRARYLIKHAEDALKQIERDWLPEGSNSIGSHVALFSAEEEQTDAIRLNQSWKPWKWHLSYADCFGFVYLVFGALGLLGGFVSVLKWIA